MKLDVLHYKYSPALRAKRNVVGTGVGYRYRGGKRTDEVCLLVFVDQKVPASALLATDAVPSEIEGVGTDVQVRRAIALQDPKAKMRPTKCGISIAHTDVTAGTLGAVMWRDGEKVILSNNHVLAATDQGKVGDFILQPGPADGGTLSDRIGSLLAFVPILAGATRDVDCAICKPDRPGDVTDEILGIGKLTGVGEIALGMNIQKSGRTTGYTRGIVSAVNVDIDVDYGVGRLIRFVGQFIADNIEGQIKVSAGGDSGSSVLDSKNRIVGLLFAGDVNGSFLVANPIQPVLNKLRLTLEQSAPEPPPSPEPPGPTPSTCPVGNGIAKVMSLAPRLLRRQGRFYYRNPRREGRRP